MKEEAIPVLILLRFYDMALYSHADRHL